MGSSQPLVYVVIINWNNPEVTTNCIRSLQNSNYQNYRVVLIDNSPSEIMKLLAHEEITDVTYISNQINLGFTGGVNQGMEYALKHGADYVWLLNNDVEVPEECLEILVKEIESDEKIGLISPIIVDPAKPLNPFYGKNVNIKTGEMLNAFDKQTYLKWLASEPWKIELWGTALLVSKSLVNAIGYLDNDFFAYYEDNDYSFRSSQAGFVNRTCLDATVIHKTDTNIYTEKKSYRFFLMARNHYLFWIKRGVAKSIAAYRTINVFIPKIIQLHREGKEIVAKPYLGGLWQGIVKNSFGPFPMNLNPPKFVYKFTVVIVGALLDLFSRVRLLKKRINALLSKTKQHNDY